MNIFVISDTHFGHANIIKYCERPFKTIEEMDAALVRKWNKVVTNDDVVIHVGDFAFSNKEGIKAYRGQLNGRIWLLRGNHDRSVNSLYEAGIEIVMESMVFVDPVSKNRCLFQHYQLEPDTARKAILAEIGCDYIIHGHAHNNTPLKDANDSRNVSCENLKYIPRLLHTIF
jgi:calcineurin-like phosphoesterase family protein